jgi:hypothetical protein
MPSLIRIERFLHRTGMPPTRFGREAVNDPRLVFDLRRGREMGRRTADRVQAFIARHENAR